MDTIEHQTSHFARRQPMTSVWDEVMRRQPALARLGAAMLLASVPIALLGIVDDRTFNGAGVWWKPAKFAVSLGIYAITLAWATGFVDSDRLRRRPMRYVVVATIAASVFEQAVITVRAGLAQGSHYNIGTPLDSLWYSLMGVGAVVLVSTSGVLAWQISRSSKLSNPARRLGWIGGLAVGSVVGGITGGYMSSQSGHWVGASTSDASGISVLGWSTTVGDLRVAHFLGLHAMFVLPFVGWAADRWLGSRPRLARAITAGALVAWTALVLAVFFRSVDGQPVV